MRYLALAAVWVALLLSTNILGQEKPAKDPVAQTKETKNAVVQKATSPDEAQKKTDAKLNEAAKKLGWIALLPEKGLDGWEVSDFGGQAEVVRKEETLVLEKGDPLTGINFKREFPKENFEIELEAQRVEGNDFLCGLTFPVGAEFCSFIAGGWGGGVVGLSSVDGYDAAENSTSSYRDFDNGKWYKFRVRVDDQAIKAWIDDREVVDQERDGHEFSTRIEVYVSRPLGFCAFKTKVAVRNFRYRMIKPDSDKPDSDKTDSK